jgi:hypothetical protein
VHIWFHNNHIRHLPDHQFDLPFSSHNMITEAPPQMIHQQIPIQPIHMTILTFLQHANQILSQWFMIIRHS